METVTPLEKNFRERLLEWLFKTDLKTWIFVLVAFSGGNASSLAWKFLGFKDQEKATLEARAKFETSSEEMVQERVSLNSCCTSMIQILDVYKDCRP